MHEYVAQANQDVRNRALAAWRVKPARDFAVITFFFFLRWGPRCRRRRRCHRHRHRRDRSDPPARCITQLVLARKSSFSPPPLVCFCSSPQHKPTCFTQPPSIQLPACGLTFALMRTAPSTFTSQGTLSLLLVNDRLHRPLARRT